MLLSLLPIKFNRYQIAPGTGENSSTKDRITHGTHSSTTKVLMNLPIWINHPDTAPQDIPVLQNHSISHYIQETELIAPILKQHISTTEQYQVAPSLRLLNINTHSDIQNLGISRIATRETATIKEWKLKQTQEIVTSYASKHTTCVTCKICICQLPCGKQHPLSVMHFESTSVAVACRALPFHYLSE